MKTFISVVASILTFTAYFTYLRDILRGRTHPHVYTWGLWTLLNALIIALQLKGGAGVAVLVLIAASICCTAVVVLGLRSGKKYITRTDTVVGILGLLAIVSWLLADQPILSLLLIMLADTFAFIPTARKSWNHPYTETLSLYVTNAIRFTFMVLAIEKYTFLSTAWTVMWVIGNAAFAALLIVRRRKFPNPHVENAPV